MHTIKFELPTGTDSLRSSQLLGILLQKWSKAQNVKYTTTGISNGTSLWLTVSFERASDISLFALTWPWTKELAWEIHSAG